MRKGTLVASKAINLHSHFKKRFEELGFDNVTVTDLEKDALKMLIREINPKLLLIGSSYYKCCTPYMVADLQKTFPKLNIAAISLSEYPPDLAMYFMINGAKSYVSLHDGLEEFYKGLNEVREGREYISPEVVKRINARSYIKPADKYTDYQLQIIRLIANGFQGNEIANTLAISIGSVNNMKSEIFHKFNARNSVELVVKALRKKIITLEELVFYCDSYVLKPKPEKNKLGGKKNGNQNEKR